MVNLTEKDLYDLQEILKNKNLTFEKYSELIHKIFRFKTLETDALALCGEAGEFANKIKKKEYQDVSKEEQLDELSDVLYSVAQIMRKYDISLEELMLISLSKTYKKNKKQIYKELLKNK